MIEAHSLVDVLPALEQADRLVHERRLWAAGFVSYEAGPAFDPAMTAHKPGILPFAWFALFDAPAVSPAPFAENPPVLDWLPSISRADYSRAIHRIKQHISRGDTYQVNYTLRMRALAHTEPESLFNAMANGQRCGYAAFIETDDFAICSASPELFFDLSGAVLTSKPMKGTAPRGLSSAEDEQNAAWLQASEKNRAENLMIVDMVRNDMGRIARTGSVQVPQLFEIERYPSVLQMTSTVSCETGAAIPEIFRALFPCASITGAPKIRTMEIIRSLEDGPRGVYTGALGFWNADRRAQFNVAIRTAVINLKNNDAEYGTGSGIVWDSEAEDEHDECLLKTRVLAAPPPPSFELLESLCWTPNGGFFLLQRHLDRLRASAQYFNYPLDEPALQSGLERAAAGWQSDMKVRVLLDPLGGIRIEASGITGSNATVHPPQNLTSASLKAAPAASPVNPDDVFLYHKTTQRHVYEAAQAGKPGMEHVLLWNPAGELTEFTTANLVLQLDGALLTPPVECGLLPGTLREELLSRGILRERVLTFSDLARAAEIWAVNSVRGWQPVRIVTEAIALQ